MWFLYQQITRCTKRALWSQRNGKDKAPPPFLPGVCLLTLIPSKTPLLFVFLLRMLRSSPDLGLPPVSIGILECAHWWLLTSRQTSGSVNTANPLHHRSLSTTVSSSLRVNTKTRERTDDRMEESHRYTDSIWMESWLSDMFLNACWMRDISGFKLFSFALVKWQMKCECWPWQIRLWLF